MCHLIRRSRCRHAVTAYRHWCHRYSNAAAVVAAVAGGDGGGIAAVAAAVVVWRSDATTSHLGCPS